MAYYSYKRVRDILIASGEIIFDEDNILKPKNQSLYGDRIDNTYLGNLYEMIADSYEKLQAENAELKRQSQWISVDDELPEFNTVVLVKVYRERGITWPKSDHSCTAKLSRVSRHCGENSPIDNRWYVFPSGGNEITKEVTHWMPLPTPPEGE